MGQFVKIAPSLSTLSKMFRENKCAGQSHNSLMWSVFSVARFLDGTWRQKSKSKHKTSNEACTIYVSGICSESPVARIAYPPFCWVLLHCHQRDTNSIISSSSTFKLAQKSSQYCVRSLEDST